MSIRYRFMLLLTGLSLLVAGFACNFSRRNAEPTAIAPPTSTVNTAEPKLEVLHFEGQIRVVLSEAYLNEMLKKEFETKDTFPLQDARIDLQDGRMMLTGKAQQGLLQTDLELILELSADGQGSVDVNIISATLGTISLPDNLLDDLSTQIKTIFESRVSPQMENFFIEEIIVADGEMTIQGHAR